MTVVGTTAESYVEASARDAVSAAELAAIRKSDKYSALQRTHFFQPIAVETLGPMNTAASSFFAELRRKISAMSGDDRESGYLVRYYYYYYYYYYYCPGEDLFLPGYRC